jgi:hypothetical protein
VKTTKVLAAAFAMLVVLMTLSSCGSTNNSALNPQFQPQVTNAANDFQFQSTAVTGVTQVLTYTWYLGDRGPSYNRYRRAGDFEFEGR